MTNSMRWGLSSLTALGLLVGGMAFNGCSSSSDPPVTVEDSGTDTAQPDTFVPPVDSSADTATDAADATDTTVPPAVPDRKITIVHASQDAGAQLFCFGAGAANTLGKALIIGKPDSTAPTDSSKYTGFTYGTVAPIAVPMDGLISKAEIDAIGSLTVYAFPIGSANPLTASAHDAAAMLTACSAKFNAFKSANPDGGTAIIDTTKFISFPGSKLVAGASVVLSATGCATPAATPAGCFGKPLALGVKLLDMTDPTFTVPDGSTGAKVAFHFMHASAFPGVTGVAPSWQAVDIYILPRSKAVAGTDAGADADSGAVASTPTGTPVKIATNVSYGDVVGVQVPAGDAGTGTNQSQPFVTPAGTDAGSSLLIMVPTGTAFCSPGTTGCLATPLPFDPWLAGYNAAFAAAGYPPVGFVNNSHQLIILSGAPSDDANPVKYGLNLGWANVSKP